MVLLTGLQWLVLVVWVTKGFFSIDEGACGGERPGRGGGGWVGLRWKRKVDIVKVLRWSSVGNTLYQ